MSVSSQMHAAPAGCSHQPFIHIRSRSPLRKKVDGGSSISHDEDRILSDLGGLSLFGHQAWSLSDSAVDEVRGILVSAPPSPLHP